MVRVYVTYPHVEVRDPSGNVILSQVDPYWVTNEEMASNKFKVGPKVMEQDCLISMRIL